MPEQTHGEGASEPSETSDRSGSTAQSESGPESLRRTAIRASALEGLGFVSSQALRLVGNLVATRLLFPEAFGLATLVNVTTTGLILLSDVGIQQSVIQNPRGEDRDFLDTAWTIQVVRGLILGALAAAFAWPFSWLYAEPILAPMMLVAAAQLVVSGFDSMSLFTLRRRVRLGWVVGVDVGSQATAVVVMLLWASVEPSVWALVADRKSTRLNSSHYS